MVQFGLSLQVGKLGAGSASPSLSPRSRSQDRRGAEGSSSPERDSPCHPLLVLWGPSTDGTMPTHRHWGVGGADMFDSVYRFKYQSLPKTPSRTHPEMLYRLSGRPQPRHVDLRKMGHDARQRSPPGASVPRAPLQTLARCIRGPASISHGSSPQPPARPHLPQVSPCTLHPSNLTSSPSTADGATVAPSSSPQLRSGRAPFSLIRTNAKSRGFSPEAERSLHNATYSEFPAALRSVAERREGPKVLPIRR